MSDQLDPRAQIAAVIAISQAVQAGDLDVLARALAGLRAALPGPANAWERAAILGGAWVTAQRIERTVEGVRGGLLDLMLAAEGDHEALAQRLRADLIAQAQAVYQEAQKESAPVAASDADSPARITQP